MLDNYEKFKKDVYALTKIDLNSYKEKQMRRRIDTLIGKNKLDTYDKYVELIKKDKEKFEQFVNFLTINVSEFYRNPEQWKILDQEVFPRLIEKFGKKLTIWSAACSKFWSNLISAPTETARFIAAELEMTFAASPCRQGSFQLYP